jgi:hypothetical protein
VRARSGTCTSDSRPAPSAQRRQRSSARGQQRWPDENGCDGCDTRSEGPVKSLLGGFRGRLRRQRTDLRWACAARRTALRSPRRATAAWRRQPPHAQRPGCRRARLATGLPQRAPRHRGRPRPPWRRAAWRRRRRRQRRGTMETAAPSPSGQRAACLGAAASPPRRPRRPRSRPRSPPRRLTPRPPRRALPRPRVSATWDAPRGAHAPHAGRSHSEAGPDSPRASLPVSAASPGIVAPHGSRTPGSARRPSSSTPSLHAHPRARLRARRPPPRARRRLALPARRGCEAPGATPRGRRRRWPDGSDVLARRGASRQHASRRR